MNIILYYFKKLFEVDHFRVSVPIFLHLLKHSAIFFRQRQNSNLLRHCGSLWIRMGFQFSMVQSIRTSRRNNQRYSNLKNRSRRPQFFHLRKRKNSLRNVPHIRKYNNGSDSQGRFRIFQTRASQIVLGPKGGKLVRFGFEFECADETFLHFQSYTFIHWMCSQYKCKSVRNVSKTA